MTLHRSRFLPGAVCCLLSAWLLGPAAAQVRPIDLVNQVDVNSYRQILDDELYTHNGDNRGVNGPEHDMARDNIEDAFISFGLETRLHPFRYNNVTYYNVVGVLPGTVTPEQQYIVGAHYDSVNNPGADDNASGTAGVIELARIFSQYEFEDTLIFIGFDREEQGLIGSRAYANEYTGDQIQGMISMDMIAYNTGAGSCDIYGRSASNTIKNALASAVTRYGDGLRPVILGQLDGSDHAPFEWVGKQACLIIEDWGNPCYHTQCDSVDNPNYIDYDYAVQITRSVAGYLAESAGLISEDTRCLDLKKLKARCKSSGKLKATVVMRNESHDGQSLTFSVDDQEFYEVTIHGKKANWVRCCYNGMHNIGIADPAECVPAKQVQCP